ncbi:MAG: TonB family protein [Nitrospiraceae bacterium]
MSADAPQSHPARYSTVCWVLSIIIHGVLVGAALALVSDLTLPPSQEPFSWDVAVVEKSTPPEPQAPPPVTPTPPEPEPVKTPAPVKPRPTRQEPVVQKTEPVQETRPMEPVQEMQQVQELQPVQEVQSVQETRPVEEARLQEALQPVQQATYEQVAAVTRPAQAESRPSREVTQSVSQSSSTVEAATSVEKPLATAQSVTEHASPTVQDYAVTSAPAAAERAAVEESQSPVEAAQKVEQPLVARTTPAVQQRTVQHMPVRAKPAARPDYGWLAQALWANVDQRKRYPAEAKRNRWEGKVVLRLTIEQRGSSVHLLDLTLEESSGHAVLDRHTQEMVRNAFPLEVKHALSQPRIQLHVPFSYSMQ